MIGFGFSRPVQAQERGALGVALSAGLGVVDGSGAFTVGASGWYRLLPALAIGVNVGSTSVIGAEQHNKEVVGATSFEGFVEGRLFPSSFLGAFGRVSAGVADVTLLPSSTGPLGDEERAEPIVDLEAGPELRLFFAPSSKRPRPDLLLRARGTLTSMSGATFLGLGLALGVEG
jgi:hypothetical protein